MFSNSLQITAEPGAKEGTRILRLNGPLGMETTVEFQRVVRAESSRVLIVDLEVFRIWIPRASAP